MDISRKEKKKAVGTRVSLRKLPGPASAHRGRCTHRFEPRAEVQAPRARLISCCWLLRGKVRRQAEDGMFWMHSSLSQLRPRPLWCEADTRRVSPTLWGKAGVLIEKRHPWSVCKLRGPHLSPHFCCLLSNNSRKASLLFYKIALDHDETAARPKSFGFSDKWLRMIFFFFCIEPVSF